MRHFLAIFIHLGPPFNVIAHRIGYFGIAHRIRQTCIARPIPGNITFYPMYDLAHLTTGRVPRVRI